MVLVWRLEKSSIHTMMPVYDANLLNFYGFQVWRLARSALYKRSPSVWMFWNSILHTKTVENQRETSSVWRCECFFGGKITYIYTRAKGVSAQQTAAFAAWTVRFGCPAGHSVEYHFTSPGLVRTTRGVGKTSPGLVKTNPGLVRMAFRNLNTL